MTSSPVSPPTSALLIVSWMMRGTTQAEAHLGEGQGEAQDGEPLVVAEQLEDAPERLHLVAELTRRLTGHARKPQLARAGRTQYSAGIPKNSATAGASSSGLPHECGSAGEYEMVSPACRTVVWSSKRNSSVPSRTVAMIELARVRPGLGSGRPARARRASRSPGRGARRAARGRVLHALAAERDAAHVRRAGRRCSPAPARSRTARRLGCRAPRRCGRASRWTATSRRARRR